MIKKLLLGVGIVLVLVIIAIGAVVYYIDAIAKTGVERATTTALGVNTSLGAMDIAILGGECEMEKLRIDNPSGYKTDYFFAMDHAAIAVNLGSLTGDKVVVPRLELEGLVINLEKQQGKSNYEVILENLRKQQSTEPTPDEKAEGKKFVVERLVIRDITVNAQLFDMVPTAIVVPEIILEDIGSDSDTGLLLDQLSGTIIEAVMASVYNVVGSQLPEEIAGPLGESLQSLGGIGEGGFEIIQGIGQLGDDPEKALGNILKGVGKTIDSAGDTAEGVGRTGEGATKSIDDVGDAVKGIGDLLGGKKKPAEVKTTNETK
jgi:hypothetical protein